MLRNVDRPRLAIAALVLAASVAMVALGAKTIVADLLCASSYERLAEEVLSPGDGGGRETAEGQGGQGSEGSPGTDVDWGALLSVNPSVCAWLTVENTTVNVPVLAAPADDPDRWLYRDVWGGSSETGTPYLDYRCDPQGSMLVVYGHRTAYVSYMFHDISPLYEQTSFDAQGPALWVTPSEALELEPLCAASVDMGDADWQRFEFGSVEELRSWLSWAVASSNARASDAEALAGRAKRALMLVTCNGRADHPTTRTLAIYVDV